MPIHVAITRRVRPGCETAFQQGLREFFQTSFAQDGVCGALMLTPPPDSDSREYGILRTFASAAERDAFYASPQFKIWDEYAHQLTEGEPEYRQLHGLEAWFRTPNAPPRWKMALMTWSGIFPLVLLTSATAEDDRTQFVRFAVTTAVWQPEDDPHAFDGLEAPSGGDGGFTLCFDGSERYAGD